MREEYTNSSIAWRIELYVFYFDQFPPQICDFREVGFRFDNPIRAFLQFLSEQFLEIFCFLYNRIQTNIT
jgi:hypothetical protein